MGKQSRSLEGWHSPGQGAGPRGTRLGRCALAAAGAQCQLPEPSQHWCWGTQSVAEAEMQTQVSQGQAGPRALLPTHFLHTESSSAWCWNRDTVQLTELELALKETPDSKWDNREFHLHHNIVPTSLLQAPISTKHACPERSGFFSKAHKESALLFHPSISGFPLLISESMFPPNATTPRGSQIFTAFAALSSL